MFKVVYDVYDQKPTEKEDKFVENLPNVQKSLIL